MKNSTSVFLALFICGFGSLYSQNHMKQWYFGSFAALDFNTFIPTPVNGSVMSANEGCASIADDNGDLMFYTDGIRVWNKNNIQMPNGFGLKGDPSSTQSGVIVPYPENDSLYYIFTADQGGYGGPNEGIQYSIVNMNLQSGLGDVTNVKNVILMDDSATEKITAVQHCNGTDFWVIVHKFHSDEFYVYPVTTSGVGAPIIQAVGEVHTDNSNDNSTIGYLKASPSSRRLALGVYGTPDFAEFFDFNNATGDITNPVLITYTGLGASDGPYGISFSPNSELVYVAIYTIFGNAAVYQYDLSSNDSATIVASETQINPNGTGNDAALQLAPNGKIYCCKPGQGVMDVIHDPDVVGIGCNFVSNDQTTGTGNNSNGLPNFIDAALGQFSTLLGPDDTICEGEVVVLDAGVSDTYIWSTGDTTQTITVDSTGQYWVQASDSGNGCFKVDTINLTFVPADPLELGEDTSLCANLTVDLTATGNWVIYNWSTGDTTATITVDTTGFYWVEVDNGACIRRDSIFVTIGNPEVQLGEDTLLCEPNLTLTVGGGQSYVWSTGSTDESIDAGTPNEYSVTVTYAGGCTSSDTINVAYDPIDVQLGPDRQKCDPNAQFTFDAQNSGASYSWSNGETTQTITTSQTGVFWVQVDNGNCKRNDTVWVTTATVPEPVINTVPDKCGTMILDGSDGAQSDWTYEWSTGENSEFIIINQEKQYFLTVHNGECEGIASADVSIEYVEPPTLVPNVFTPNGDNFNETLEFSLPETEWVELKIFNRWGRLLFETTNISNHWSGGDNPAGIYNYVLTYKKLCGDEAVETLSGYVTMLR